MEELPVKEGVSVTVPDTEELSLTVGEELSVEERLPVWVELVEKLTVTEGVSVTVPLAEGEELSVGE